MKPFTVVISVLVLSALACSVQVAPPEPTTPLPTVVIYENPVTTVLTTPESSVVTVSQVLVNVRASPNGSVIGYAKSGDTLAVISCSGAWCQVRKPDGAKWKQETGYIFRGCISNNPDKLGCNNAE